MRLNTLIGAILAQDCLLCAAPGGEDLLCAPCAADLPRTGSACPRCADAAPAGNLCGACLADPPHYDATTSLWRYEFPLDRLILALKYGERLALAAYFGQALARQHINDKPYLLLPMPLHPRRLRERGFNQAAEIVRAAAKPLKLPWKSDVLQRVRDTAPQTDLPVEERVRNVKDAFLCMADLSGKTVVVIDDVMTTGATLNEAAAALKKAGAARVENWVVARA